MSFYNADPRAYFQWYDKKWDEVWDGSKWTIDDLEVGRLVRIINKTNSVIDQNSSDNNYKIYKVTTKIENNQTVKTLEKFDLTNPYSMAIGENTNANRPNQTVVGKNNAESQNALFIVGNGSGTGQNPTANAFEVLDGSNNEPGIKIGGYRLSIAETNNQNLLYIEGEPYGSPTVTIENGVKFQPASGISENNMEIGELYTNPSSGSPGPWPDGTIYFPDIITQSETIGTNNDPQDLTITGTTTTAKLTLDTHPIIILTQHDYDDLSSINENTLYIVIPNPSSST